MAACNVLFLVMVLAVLVSAGGSVSAPSQQPKGRIGNGKLAGRQQFPFQVRIRLEDAQVGTLSVFSGVLVDAYWVLTAAFELVKVYTDFNNNVFKPYTNCPDTTDCPPQFVVDVGVTYMSGQYTNQSSRALHGITEIEVHPNYTLGGKFANIALIKLDRPVRINEYVEVAPFSEYMGRRPAIGTRGTISGWGATEQPNQYGVNLKFADVRVVRECMGVYPEDDDIMFRSGVFCAKPTDGAVTCVGDVGGPFVDSMGVVHGIMFAGEHNPCSPPGNVGFVSVRAHLGWINRVIHGCLPAFYDSAGVNPSVPCSALQVVCGADEECLDITARCNGFPDCSDNSDENPATCTVPSARISDNEDWLVRVRWYRENMDGLMFLVCNEVDCSVLVVQAAGGGIAGKLAFKTKYGCNQMGFRCDREDNDWNPQETPGKLKGGLFYQFVVQRRLSTLSVYMQNGRQGPVLFITDTRYTVRVRPVLWTAVLDILFSRTNPRPG